MRDTNQSALFLCIVMSHYLALIVPFVRVG
jgi:hypothetical protein